MLLGTYELHFLERSVRGIDTIIGRLRLTTPDSAHPDSLPRRFSSSGGASVVGWYRLPSDTSVQFVRLENGNLFMEGLTVVYSHTAPLELRVRSVGPGGFSGSWIHPYDYVYPVDEYGRTIRDRRGWYCARRVE